MVTGAGSPGISTITITSGDLTATAEIVLHGPVKTISAELEQGAIEVGGGTRIVVTALDTGGNPVANQHVAEKTQGGVTPPERLAKGVDTSNTVNKDGDGDGTVDKGDLPACGTLPAVSASDQTDGDPPTPPLQFESSGTNGAGQCVIQVTAAPDPNGAARGTHTITLVASEFGDDGSRGVNEASVEVQVGGPPAAIESDAPERIDPSTELTVNVTVSDDEDVRVGRVDIEVIHTAGDGAIITDIAGKTTDGRAKFTYLAPSTPGVDRVPRADEGQARRRGRQQGDVSAADHRRHR